MPLSRIHQIAVVAKDLDRATAWYRDTLGLTFLFTAPPGMSFFDCGGVRLLVGHETLHPAGSATATIYFGVEDIVAEAEALKARGVTIHAGPSMIARLPDREVWLAEFRDSEGNNLALMSEPKIR